MSYVHELWRLLAQIREREGFASVSIGEADPRTMGGPHVALGWNAENGLRYAVIDDGPEFVPITAAEFAALFPYCTVRPPEGVYR